MTDKNVREELAELTEAVRELRDREVADELRSLRAEVEKLRAERPAGHCHGHGMCCSGHHCNWGHCGCWTHHVTWGTATYPLTWTVTSSTMPAVTYDGTAHYVGTASGAITSYTVTN